MLRRAKAASRVFLKWTRRSDPRACRAGKRAAARLRSNRGHCGGSAVIAGRPPMLKFFPSTSSRLSCASPSKLLARHGQHQPGFEPLHTAAGQGCQRHCRPAAASGAPCCSSRDVSPLRMPLDSVWRGGPAGSRHEHAAAAHMPPGCSRRLQHPGPLLTAAHAVQSRLEGRWGEPALPSAQPCPGARRRACQALLCAPGTTSVRPALKPRPQRSPPWRPSAPPPPSRTSPWCSEWGGTQEADGGAGGAFAGRADRPQHAAPLGMQAQTGPAGACYHYRALTAINSRACSPPAAALGPAAATSLRAAADRPGSAQQGAQGAMEPAMFAPVAGAQTFVPHQTQGHV